MPLYQLPNGKVVYISIEDYLELTSEDIQTLIAFNDGVQPSNPFFNSVIYKSGLETQEDYYNNDGLDYEEDDKDVESNSHNSKNLSDDDFDYIS